MLLSSGICFAILPFRGRFDPVYASIQEACYACGLRAKRGDSAKRSGAVLDQITGDIDSAAICVADLSHDPEDGNTPNPNVLYEVGVAHSRGKKVILLSRDLHQTLPFDLRHLRVLSYDAGNRQALTHTVEQAILDSLDMEGPPVRLLREMLLPAGLGGDDSPFVMAASPLTYRAARQKEGGWDQIPTTFGDQVGIRGLLQAFGALKGVNVPPVLANPDDFRAGVEENAMHLYTIGSSKANRWTEAILTGLGRALAPEFWFAVDPESQNLRDPRVQIQRDDDLPFPEAPDGSERTTWDYGLMIRTPNPFAKDHLSMVLAGRSALGTHAACLGATDPAHIAQIKKQLGELGVSMGEFSTAFWALLKLEAHHIVTSQDSYAWVVDSTAEVLEVGLFRPR